MFSNIARKSRSLFQEVFKQGKTAGVNTGNERERERERERPSGDWATLPHQLPQL